MAGSKKSRRKGKRKGKKSRKKNVTAPSPLPLHSLTDIYTNLEIIVNQLMDARVLARKKRIEANLMAEDILNQKRDDAVYKEHIRNALDEVADSIEDIAYRLSQEKEAIQHEVDRINSEYQKMLLSTLKRIEAEEKKLEDLRSNLIQYDHLKRLVQKLEYMLAALKDEYERVILEIMIKTRHLRNQYLSLRAELYNYLQQQLAILIAKAREYILPIAWDAMIDEEKKNRCNRWSFKNEDENNSKLLEQREKYLRTIESLEWESKYYGTEWVFKSLDAERCRRAAEKLRWKRRLEEKKLSAVTEAKERQVREDKLKGKGKKNLSFAEDVQEIEIPNPDNSDGYSSSSITMMSSRLSSWDSRRTIAGSGMQLQDDGRVSISSKITLATQRSRSNMPSEVMSMMNVILESGLPSINE